MAAKQLIFDEEARSALRRGADTLAKVVGVTLGPRGRNVILQKSFGAPVVTSDGVTVAKEIELPDYYENIGAQLLKSLPLGNRGQTFQKTRFPATLIAY